MNDHSRCKPVRGITFLRAGLLSLALSLTMALSSQATTISGFVWHDLNENGIQDVGEPGISNAIVQLLEFPASNVVDGVLTDINGIYLFTNVAPGDYFIRIPPPSGFTVTTNNAGVDPTLDSDIDSGGQTPAFTFVGDPITDLDAGFYIIQPGISLTKLAGDAPDGGILYVTNGTEVTYTYIITNTGNIHLSFISLTDDVLFPAGGDDIVELANCFGFDPGIPLNMAPGDVITYTTQAVINASVTNIALVEALAIDFKTCSIIGNVDPAVDEDDAIVIVVTPGYTLEKTVSTPFGRAAAIGESVVFEITLVNTGDVDLVTIPLVDTYDTTFLSYVSALPPSDNNVNDGIINWVDVGPLPIGASTSVFATFTAIASTVNSETNTVVATPTTPPEVPGVPPKPTMCRLIYGIQGLG
jgi:hypothetical protein